MKKTPNISLWVLSLLLVGNLFLSSCDKDKDAPETASIALIATAKSYYENGDLDYSESYQYDNQGRVIKMDSNDSSHAALEYAGSTVIIRNYDENELNETSTAQLNSKGLCTSISWEDGEDLQTYEYDSNDYRKSWIYKNGSYVTTILYTISEGNIANSILTDQSNTENSALAKKVAFLKRSSLIANLQKRIVSENRLKSATEIYTSKTDFQFYQDKINTIGHENIGIPFFGKQNKNPIKQETNTLTYNGEISEPEIITYTYEYDAKGRITKNTSSDGDYTVYTYVD